MATATRALAKFGVYGPAQEHELRVLALANEYRDRLAALNHDHHREWIDFRNERFPLLYAAMIEWESAKAAKWQIERQIKQHHSDVRDRDALTDEQRSRLVAARERTAQARAAVQSYRKSWLNLCKQFRACLVSQIDSETRKNLKSLAKRREAYANLQWPDDIIGAYAEIEIRHDIAQRELSLEFQSRGLHSSIRAEIVEATKPKTSATGPGMRYEYHRKPNPKAWQKITLQISGGLTIDDALAGRCRSLRLTEQSSRKGKRGNRTVYRVMQQIGTAADQVEISYVVNVDRPFPPGATIQRWTLQVGGDYGSHGDLVRRQVIPIVACDQRAFAKPTGRGVFAYDLRWTSTDDGVLVCQFHGDHVNEDLIIPHWIVRRRMRAKEMIAESDNIANDWLENKRQVARSKRPGARHGTDALADWVAANPDDHAAANVLHNLLAHQRLARRLQRRSVRCIDDIYRTVAYRVCSRHDRVLHDSLDLRAAAKYDTRDLLRPSLPRPVRELRAAMAVGKLASLIRGYGLSEARGEALPETPVVARGTDVFTTYVRSLGRNRGVNEAQNMSRSQSGSGGIATQ